MPFLKRLLWRPRWLAREGRESGSSATWPKEEAAWLPAGNRSSRQAHTWLVGAGNGEGFLVNRPALPQKLLSSELPDAVASAILSSHPGVLKTCGLQRGRVRAALCMVARKAGTRPGTPPPGTASRRRGLDCGRRCCPGWELISFEVLSLSLGVVCPPPVTGDEGFSVCDHRGSLAFALGAGACLSLVLGCFPCLCRA